MEYEKDLELRGFNGLISVCDVIGDENQLGCYRMSADESLNELKKFKDEVEKEGMEKNLHFGI